MAEQAAWDFLKALPENERFELVTINPSLILGPSLISTDFTSGQIVKNILEEKFPGMPKINFPVVDVRDVALAHLRGIKIPEAKNQRFILISQSVWLKDIAGALKREYG